ncbi:hypothetical protein ACEWY4_001109 [Coilia grayii]|uniref:Uncharacterized protein n=1 Tax=Coilia grayii TaxID=363190 RepID=A0ABD1KZ06_9TELE
METMSYFNFLEIAYKSWFHMFFRNHTDKMALRRLFPICLFILLMADFGVSAILKVNNGGPWGDWNYITRCPRGSYAYGFSLKVERKQGNGDDTALNGIKLFCKDPSNPHNSTSVKSEQIWGEWTSGNYCPSGRLDSFQLRVERDQGNGDDTAANNIRFGCTDGSIIEGYGLDWGDWGYWSGKCSTGICSMMTRLEAQLDNGDDTALNDVQMFCCPY